MRAAAVSEFITERYPTLHSVTRSSAVHLVQVAGTRAFMQIMTFVVMASIARHLGPTSFGVYAFATLVAVSLSELLGAGIDMTAVRISAPHWRASAEKAWAVFQVVGSLKLGLGLTLIVLGLAGADWLSTVVLGQPEMAGALRTAVVAAVAIALTEFGLSILQARQDFGTLTGLGIVAALLRAAPFFFLIAADRLTVSIAFVAYVGSLYVSCLLILWPSYRPLLATRARYAALVRDLLGYAGWLSLAVILGTAANYADTIALTYFKGPRAVGVYAAARTFAIAIAVIHMASVAVLLPLFGRIEDGLVRRRAVVRAAWLIGGLALVVMAAMMLAASPLVGLFYGREYVEAIPVLRVLAAAYSLELATSVLIVFLLVENRPDVLAKATGIGLLAAIVGYALVVPTWGAVGTAYVLLGGRLVGTVICGLWLIFFLPAAGRAAEPTDVPAAKVDRA